MSDDLENITVNNAKVNANLNIALTSNPSIHLPDSATNTIEKFYSNWSGETYAINLARLACTCPNYIQRGQYFHSPTPEEFVSTFAKN